MRIRLPYWISPLFVVAALLLAQTTLVVAAGSNPSLVRMARNLPYVKCVSVQSLNLLDVLQYRSMLVLQDAVPAMEKMFA